MDATEKRQLETELLKMGLPGLQANGDPSLELIGQLANIVNEWKGAPNRHGEWIDRHKFLRDLLAECDKKDRTAMYEAIRPHLKFVVRPLAQYESMMTERMSGLISKRAAMVEGRSPHPIEVGKKKYAEVPAVMATQAIATLKCYKCKRAAKFVGDTPAGAMIAGRKAGWVRDMSVVREVCPKCSKKIVN